MHLFAAALSRNYALKHRSTTWWAIDEIAMHETMDQASQGLSVDKKLASSQYYY